MPLDVVSICNRTLDLLSVDPISSLEDGSKAARVMQRNYEPVRDRILAMYPWNSAMRRAVLAADSVAPAWGFERQFRLPEGPDPAYCLKVWKLQAQEEGYRVSWSVEGRMLLTDEPAPLRIRYIARVTDPALFDPLLSEAIAAGLGVYAGGTLVEAASRMEFMRNYLKDVLAQAKAADAREGGDVAVQANDFLTVRI